MKSYTTITNYLSYIQDAECCSKSDDIASHAMLVQQRFPLEEDWNVPKRSKTNGGRLRILLRTPNCSDCRDHCRHPRDQVD